MSGAKVKANVEKNIVQAVVILNTFQDEFRPISDDLPPALLTLIDKPAIEYTLEYLALAGVEETFLFCCTHIEVIKAYIKKCLEELRIWSLKMKVNIIASETCCSFGDCLRDIDAKGILRSNFILVEPGVISNIKLLPVLEEHAKNLKQDKGAAMTLILQESTVEHFAENPLEEMILAFDDSTKKILSHKKVGLSIDPKVNFPLEIFIENPCVSIVSNLRDTGISVCSPAVLPLFADNFDFQTKDDFVRGLLMNEEILESTLYCHISKTSEYGSAIDTWRTYRIVSWEFLHSRAFPIVPSISRSHLLKNSVVVSNKTKLPKSCVLNRCVIGENVSLGEGVKIEDSFIFSNTKLGDNVSIYKSILGENCVVQANSVITNNSILGNGVVIGSGKHIDNKLIKASDDEEDSVEKLDEKAFIITDDDEEDLEDVEIRRKMLTKPFRTCDEYLNFDNEELSESEEEEMSCTYSPAPDDTKLFFTEVIDSLTRGFEDKLLCDNLILEVNSSRYAYNVTVSEVNFNVMKALLHMSLKNTPVEKIVSNLASILNYFNPLVKNYIRNDSAMTDCLLAVEDVATSEENVTGKWIIFSLKWLYDREHISEEAILKWFGKLNEKGKIYSHVKPFTDWLSQAEEASSSGEDSSSEEEA